MSDMALKYGMKKRMARGGMLTDSGYQSECNSDCNYPCAVHPESSGFVEHEGDDVKKNGMAMSEDDRRLGQHGEDEQGPDSVYMAQGGYMKGINKQSANRQYGTSDAGHFAKYKTSGNDGSKEYTNEKAKGEHRKVLDEMKEMPKPKLPMAEGGMLTDSGYQTDAEMLDMVGRIMAKRQMHYSEGGKVANSDLPEADFMPNEFDDLHLRDDLESSYTGANSGDELGGPSKDDMVARIMMKRRKQHNPNPA